MTKEPPPPTQNGSAFRDLYEEQSTFIDKHTLVETITNINKNDQIIASELHKTYQENLRPLEEVHRKLTYDQPLIDEAYFHSRPLILLIGQYSSGKTTFVKYLLDKEYPGLRIDHSPSTDKFIAVMHGRENSIIPGNALVIDQSKPFKDLIKFGSKFLNRFQASITDAKVLKGLTIIDTPGILTDNNNSDGYDYKGVIEWFARRADRIFLFVDSNKLELSGDFQQIVQMIRDYDDKLRIVLNKTDLVSEQELIRLYGALMWFLGQTLDLKEVIQIYLGSFWGKALTNSDRRKLYDFDEYRIFEDLANLPKETLLRKANLVVKRAQEVSIHAFLIDQLRLRYRKHGTRFLLGFKTQKRRVSRKIQRIYEDLESKHNLNRSDFPDVAELKSKLRRLNWRQFPELSPSLMHNKDRLVSEIIPSLVTRINDAKVSDIFDANDSPFAFERGEGFDEGLLDQNYGWIVDKYCDQWLGTFKTLAGSDEKICASKAKAFLLESNLPSKVLGRIWKLADVDKDDMLDLEEFLLAMYLVRVKVKKNEAPLPEVLPSHLVPLSKR